MKKILSIILGIFVLFFLYSHPVTAATKQPLDTNSLVKNSIPPCSKIVKQPVSQNKTQENQNIFVELGEWLENLFAKMDIYVAIPIQNTTKTVQPIPCEGTVEQGTVGAISPTETITPSPTTGITVTVTPTPGIVAIAKKGQVKLMPLGDSITDGAIISGGYRTELWKRLVQGDGDTIDFVGSLSSGPGDLGDRDHEGLIGWTIAQLDGSVSGWIAAYQPDIILLHIGTNDLDHGGTPESMTQSLSKLIGDIYAAKGNTYIIVSTLIPTTHGAGSTWSSFNASIPGIAAQYNGQGRRIVVLDMSHTLTTGDLADGLHPNATGYSKMANMWYPVVTTIYKEVSGK